MTTLETPHEPRLVERRFQIREGLAHAREVQIAVMRGRPYTMAACAPKTYQRAPSLRIPSAKSASSLLAEGVEALERLEDAEVRRVVLALRGARRLLPPGSRTVPS